MRASVRRGVPRLSRRQRPARRNQSRGAIARLTSARHVGSRRRCRRTVSLPYGLASAFRVHHLLVMRSRQMSLLIAALATVSLLAACARTVWLKDDESPECRGYRPLGAPPVQLVGDNSTRTGSVAGTVVDVRTGEPIGFARVALRSPRKDTAFTDSRGRFRLDSVGMGRLIFSTGRIGYHFRTDTMPALPSTGVALWVPMTEFTLDGPCSGFSLVRVREPWWKFWVVGVRDSSLK